MKYVFNSKGENAICRLWKERQCCFRVYKGNVHFIFRFFLFLFVLLTAQWALASTITKWPLLGEEFSLAYIFTCTFCKPSQGCSHTHTHSLSTWVFISLKLSRKKKKPLKACWVSFIVSQVDFYTKRLLVTKGIKLWFY